MLFIVLAEDGNCDFLSAPTSLFVIKRVYSIDDLLAEKNADGYFNLLPDSYAANYTTIQKPIFINSVSHTLQEINALKNVIRINGWAGFLQKDIWEIAGNFTTDVQVVLTALKKNYILVPDVVGFVTARVIAMIINEAYFALEDGVSTKKDIDTAMKLGTNYPYGPFEWASIIGENNIYSLLNKLSLNDLRYLPAKTLQV